MHTKNKLSVVSSRYEKALPQAIKHVVTGDIVRMLLIQVQFIKKELLVAVGAKSDSGFGSCLVSFPLQSSGPVRHQQ